MADNYNVLLRTPMYADALALKHGAMSRPWALFFGSLPKVVQKLVQSAAGVTKFVIEVSGSNFLVNGTAIPLSDTLPIQSLPLATTAAGTIFQGVLMRVVTPFERTGSAVAVYGTLGTTTAQDALMMMGGDTFDLTQTVAFYQAGGLKVLSFDPETIAFTISTPAHNPAELTGGSAEIYLISSVLP